VGELLIYGTSLGALAMFLIAIYMFLRGRENAYARLDSTGGADVDALSVRKANSKVQKSLTPFREMLKKEKVDVSNKRKNLLVSAGYYGKDAPVVYYTVRLIMAALVCVLSALLMFILQVMPSAPVLVMFMTGAALFGSFLPFLFVKSRIGERRQKFTEGLPDSLDMLLVCLESGLSFPAALKYVAHDMEAAHPMVSEQFQIATLEFQAGRKRAETLLNLAQRVDTPEIHSIVMMIIQSDNLGTSLTRSLRAAADDLRKDRMLKAEEKATALPAKMSVPLVLCIFPTLFAIIMVPVIVTIIREIPG